MKKIIAALACTAGLIIGADASAQIAKPTVVLVHGAFADASSWNGVVKILEKDGYTVVSAANPLRSVKGDGAAVSALLGSIQTPVVLVGHSYGGNVISEAANDHANVKALVYVSAFAPEAGETVAGLAGKFPGSTLGPTLAAPVPLADGGKDLYIQQGKFHDQFAADVPAAQAALMAANQRPVTEAALNEQAGTPAWKHIPSWYIYGDKDKNIPPQAMAFMAKRADARDVKVVKGASHVVMVSHPEPVARLIEEAATAK
ncbi:alpha/beta hydrolase [Pseudomonas corrugata]|uniref:Alpha/beta hydrolase n=1 Tax=Pseudomonas corrugata TaxID=47879 RepID=A0A8B6UXH3_9PSED|nr:alpha/beta hydrolase [Pseudomonas corrugata]MDU9025805.1 alpha/beta hydrolase [Pseudomonas corrugata]MDU9035796.1 alpha/beta hydrolase [Pseudomonas corrugata]QTH16600.1 alpha/beta hydrolase [Pseudomonas corrugata]UZD98009.1 alpha/beta hydrolase [Pseudomonas corrugata]UZE08467.1 alpha/beta hydrolase [Pseudomonas corrugata]